VLPVFVHAFSSKQGLASFEDRLHMCELGLLVSPNARVMDAERRLALESAAAARLGSVDVLDALQREFPAVTRWSWVLGAALALQRVSRCSLARSGADTFADLRAGRWKEGERFQRQAHLYVVEREGEAVPQTEGCNATLLRVPGLGGTSSTAVRAALAGGKETPELHPAVLVYALERGLYSS